MDTENLDDYRKKYALNEARGLKHLHDEHFVSLWVEWVAHLKAKSGGKNPTFATIQRHKEALNDLSTENAKWALDEALRRGLPFPADATRRPAQISQAPAAIPPERLIPDEELCGPTPEVAARMKARREAEQAARRQQPTNDQPTA